MQNRHDEGWMVSRGSTANVQRTRSTINSSRHSRIFWPESKMSGTEFHQLQSLAMTRPINPKTQEKQVLYEALRDDPQVQAARYKMDYGTSSSNAMVKRSRQIRRQMIRKMNKFKTTRADIDNLLHSNGTFPPKKPKRSMYANEAAKKIYYDAKKEFEKQPTPLSSEEKEELKGLKSKFEENNRAIDELRRKVAALAGGKQRLNPTNVKHIRQKCDRRVPMPLLRLRVGFRRYLPSSHPSNRHLAPKQPRQC